MTQKLYKMYQAACNAAEKHKTAQLKAIAQYEKEYGCEPDEDSRFMAGIANFEGGDTKELLDSEAKKFKEEEKWYKNIAQNANVK